MTIEGFKEINDLNKLTEFVERSKIAGSLLGKKIVVQTTKGKQTVSEAQIWKKFKEIQSQATTSAEEAGLCAYQLTQLHEKLESAPWFIRNFKSFFGFLTDKGLRKQISNMIQQLHNTTVGNPEEKQKAVLVAQFMAKYGERFPKLRTALHDSGISPAEGMYDGLAQTIFEDVPLNEIHKFLEESLFFFIPDHNKFAAIKAKVREKLATQEGITEKMLQLFPENRKTKELKDFFNDILNPKLGEEYVYSPQAQSQLRKLFTPAKITEMLDLLYAVPLYTETRLQKIGEEKVWLEQPRNTFIGMLEKNNLWPVNFVKPRKF